MVRLLVMVVGTSSDTVETDELLAAVILFNDVPVIELEVVAPLRKTKYPSPNSAAIKNNVRARNAMLFLLSETKNTPVAPRFVSYGTRSLLFVLVQHSNLGYGISISTGGRDDIIYGRFRGDI